MNNVYLVTVDNGETFDDYMEHKVKVFKSFRAATQYLLDDGYSYYPSTNWNGSIDLRFTKEIDDDYGNPTDSRGWIEELEFADN